MNENNIFHEDNRKLKRTYRFITLLFYIGFFSGLTAIIIYRIIKPSGFITHYQPQGEDILVTALCLVAAIVYSIAVIRFSNYIENIDITKSEISFIVLRKLIKYSTTDLLDYQIKNRRLFYSEYVLIFKDNRSFYFISSNKANLSSVLNKMLGGSFA